MTTASPTAKKDIATRQSLAHGPLGVALLHIERAHRGTDSWQAVHRQLAAIGPLMDGNEANLFLGAPAMAYALHLAAIDSDRYANALHTLDAIVAAHTRRRLSAAHMRIPGQANQLRRIRPATWPDRARRPSPAPRSRQPRDERRPGVPRAAHRAAPQI